MFVEQIFQKNLSQYSYFLESSGEAIVIDPVRDPAVYLEIAKKRGSRIVGILLTHVHEDYVAGHVELAAETGAWIGLGKTATALQFAHRQLLDGTTIPLGSEFISVLATPGHADGALCFRVPSGGDEQKKRPMLFTGDTILVGDIGRLDLRADVTIDDACREMYSSLRRLASATSDDTEVFPGHGEGNVSCLFYSDAGATSTMGQEKCKNPGLSLALTQNMEFFTSVMRANMFSSPPVYFSKIAEANASGSVLPTSQLIGSVSRALSLQDIDTVWSNADPSERPLILDTRPAQDFCDGHIPGSVFFGMSDGNLAPYLATALPQVEKPLIVIAEDSTQLPAIASRVSSCGYQTIVGHLTGGFSSWRDAKREVETMPCVDVEQLAKELQEKGSDAVVIDSRKPHEYRNVGHLDSAVMLPLESRSFQQMDMTKSDAYCYCRSGYRSVAWLSIAVSLFGYKGRPVNILGGYKAMNTSKTFGDKLKTGFGPFAN